MKRFRDLYQGFLVLLLDTKAAGPGLDLSVANKLVFIDTGWDVRRDRMVVETIWRCG